MPVIAIPCPILFSSRVLNLCAVIPDRDATIRRGYLIDMFRDYYKQLCHIYRQPPGYKTTQRWSTGSSYSYTWVPCDADPLWYTHRAERTLYNILVSAKVAYPSIFDARFVADIDTQFHGYWVKKQITLPHGLSMVPYND